MSKVSPPAIALEMLRLYTEEERTLQEIGDQYEVTRERVRQRLKPLLTSELRQGVKTRRHAKTVQRYWEVARCARPRFLQLVAAGMEKPAMRAELGVSEAILTILLDSLDDATRKAWQCSTHAMTPSQRRYSPEDMLAALREAASLNGGRIGHKRYSALRRSHPVWPSAALYQVKGWNYWQREAGLPVTARPPHLGNPQFSEAHCREAAALVAAKLGRLRYSQAEYRANRRSHDPTDYALVSRFGQGGWVAAREHLLDGCPQ